MSPVVESPRVTIALPSLNQGRFLEATLRSIFSQPINAEVMCADGGSQDESREVIERWRDKLTWWRSGPDAGQAAAINEAIGEPDWGEKTWGTSYGSSDMWGRKSSWSWSSTTKDW